MSQKENKPFNQSGETENCEVENLAMTNSRTKLALHIEPQFTKEDAFVLEYLIGKVRHSGMVCAEIGSFLGNGSTQAIIKAIKDVGGTLFCIDTWKGNQNVEWHLNLSHDYNLFNTFLYNVEKAGGGDVVKPIYMTSKDSGNMLFQDHSCDLIFIDGDHSYESVMEDISIWMSKVRHGGILCGHDCEGAMHTFDSNLINANHQKDFMKLENFIFEGVHPGVVKAVDTSFNGDVKIWANENLTGYGFNGRSTIWSITVGLDYPHNTSKDKKLAEKAKFIEILDSDVYEWKTKAEALNKGFLDWQEKTAALSREIANKVALMQALSMDLAEWKTKAETFGRDILDKNSLIEALNKDVADKAGLIQTLGDDIINKNNHIDKLSKELADKALLIHALNMDLAECKAKAEAISKLPLKVDM